MLNLNECMMAVPGAHLDGLDLESDAQIATGLTYFPGYLI
jgi:hypothetical protein